MNTFLRPLFYIPLFFFTNLYAQELGSYSKIRGVVVDSTTGIPIPYNTALFMKSKDNKVLDAAITDEKGLFVLENITQGLYKIKIDFLGYDKKIIDNIKIKEDATLVDLGVIKLTKSVNALEEVVIKSEKPVFENKMDRYVFNVENKSAISGGASELLRTIPMTTVDINGNVSLRGNGSVKILIDGKPSGSLGNNGEILQSIPSSQIKSIEIITSPSAKYDAEGSGGIINIITRKTTFNGIKGSVVMDMGTRRWKSSLNLNGKHKKLIFGASFGINNKWPREVRTEYFSLDEVGNSSSSNGIGENERLTNNSSATLQYDFNDRNSVSTTFIFSSLGFNDDIDILSENESLGNSLISYETNTFGERSNTGFDWNADYLHKFNAKGEELSIATQWRQNTRNEDYRSNFSDFFENQQANSNAKNDEYTFQIDYVKLFKESIKFEIGTKGIFREIESVNDFFNIDDQENISFNSLLSNIYNYQQDVYAAYVSLRFDIGQGWGVQLGNRFEATKIKGKSSNTQSGALPFTSNFNNNIPNFVLAKEFKNFDKIKISYNKRIQRPSLEYINPFSDTSDPLNQTQGTPDLSPELTHTIELTYNPYIEKINSNISLYYRKTDDIIESLVQTIPFTDNTSGNNETIVVNLTTFQNIGFSESFGLNFFNSFNINDKISIQGSFDIYSYRAEVKSDFRDFLNTGTFFQYNGFASLNYKLPYDIVFSTFYSFQSEFRNFQGTRSNLNIWNLSITKDILKKKGVVGVSVTNPLNDTWDFTDNIQTQRITTRNVLKVPLRSFNLKFYYQFGKFKSDLPTDRGVKNDDLKNKPEN